MANEKIKDRNNDTNFLSYSVLMSVYVKDIPEYLKIAIQSMLNQTVRTDDFVIVCDGPLTPELEGVLKKYNEEYSGLFNILYLSKNSGLGNALNQGLKLCKNEIIARMDSDDISLSYRCELQLKEFQKDAELALCSGNIAEFKDDVNNLSGIRRVPEKYEEIVRFSKKRSPMNHVATMFKRSAVENVGGYIELNCTEDYYLWARILNKGYKAINVPKVLVNVRIGNGMYKRRGGIRYIKNCLFLQKKMLDIGFITFPEFLRNCIIRIFVCILPECFRGKIYQIFLRDRTMAISDS